MEERVIRLFDFLGVAINFVTPDETDDLTNLQKFYNTTIEPLPSDLSQINS